MDLYRAILNFTGLSLPLLGMVLIIIHIEDQIEDQTSVAISETEQNKVSTLCFYGGITCIVIGLVAQIIRGLLRLF